jgi:hypothetical protein
MATCQGERVAVPADICPQARVPGRPCLRDIPGPIVAAMDASFAPIILAALTVGIVASAIELRAATMPPACPECEHCRARARDHQAAADERRRRQEELQGWYARRNGLDRDEDERRLD